MKKVCFVGAPGSGKTTLANLVFTELKKKSYKTEFAPELIRYDIYKNGSPQNLWEQLRYLLIQSELENNISKNRELDYLICDGGVLLPHFFCYSSYFLDKVKVQNNNHNRTPESLIFKDTYEVLIDAILSGRYSHIFYVENNPEPEKDGLRFQTNDEIKNLAARMECFFFSFGENFNIFKVPTFFEQRLDFVMNKILQS